MLVPTIKCPAICDNYVKSYWLSNVLVVCMINYHSSLLSEENQLAVNLFEVIAYPIYI